MVCQRYDSLQPGRGEAQHGSEKVPSLDRTKNGTAQIRTVRWRSAVYMKRIRKYEYNGCWFFSGRNRMARSHALFHDLVTEGGREAAWEGKEPSAVGVLLENPG